MNRFTRREFLGLTFKTGAATMVAGMVAPSVGSFMGLGGVAQAASKKISPFTFAILTDSHLYDIANHKFDSQLAKGVADVNNMNPRPDFVLYAGDIGQSGKEDEAVALVDEFNLDGMAEQDDWRLPKVPELASIVERQCFNPRVNETVFPGAPSVLYWSSMEKKGEADYVYALDFGAGAAQAMRKDSKGAVRLVRGGPWWTPPKMSDSQ